MTVLELLDKTTGCWLEEAGVGQHLKDLSNDSAIEVMFYAPLKETMEKIVAEENCEIVQLDGDAESLKATIKKKGAWGRGA